MTDDADLLALAVEAGLSPRWRDVYDEQHDVAPDTLRAALAALGLPAATPGDLRASRAALQAQARETPSLLTARIFTPIPLHGQGGARLRLVLEDGTSRDVVAEDGMLPAIDIPGYHRLELPDRAVTLAVAPTRCVTAPDLVPAGENRHLWGIAVQLYALRHPGDGGIGDFTALAQFVRAAAGHGADAVAISPVHALFNADLGRFSPYSPSSRVQLNALHVDAGAPDDPTDSLQAEPLIDWPEASRRKLARLRAKFRAMDAPTRAALAAFRAARGDELESHARFEALHAHFLADGIWHWRNWPAEYHHPGLPAVAAFAEKHHEEVAFHAFLQFLADAGLGAAQLAARQAGMAIGLVSDLAVGTDNGGSHCWARQSETLIGLSVGAPPDLLGPAGQDWGLTTFSPRGLALNGYGAFIDMLRASLRHAGGVRIDHVMGLSRLWVIPDGAGATEGVYVRFPEQELFRLVALESQRHRAIVIGEDLGTVPDGYQERLTAAGIAGLRVLWFERTQDSRFRPPREWTRGAVAMSSTHDLATVAGWWEGRDLDWRENLDLLPDPAMARDERNRDKGLLWQAFRDSGAALHDAPGPLEGHHAAGSAAVHIGASPCDLAMMPIEDVLALREQPNLPGTILEHPNWRRRMPGLAADLLDDPAAGERLAALAAARQTPV